ncbi:hypothetical protein TIFTF001_020297 [Ficus carica]|uniref:phosphoribosyl-AMP cyclohydrolase n=1 Tax=Ficus carica TaxID=3494 RepID=A0AA88AFT6_FICCA|nr:hypothetical protein TIFTF001_020297 [Ficus carica]
MDRVDLEAQSENIDLENAVNVDTKLDEDVIELGGSDIDKSLKKKRLKSKVWEFFDVLPLGPDKKLKSVYKKCGHQYLASSKYGTGNMLKHIKTCPRTETREIGQMLITRDSNSLSFGSSQFDSEKWRELVTTCIILHELPFRFVEYKGVRAMLQYLLPSVDLVSRNTAKADTLKLYKRVNKDAVATTISSRKATFYSRSRSTLWTKGETSKNFINEIACCCARAWSSTISDIADEVNNLPAISDTRWRSVTRRAVKCEN